MSQCDCKVCLVLPNSNFKGLRPENIDVINEIKVIRHFDKNQIIAHEGQSLDGIYCLRDGRVKLERINRDGVAVTLSYFEGGDVIGVPSVFLSKAIEGNLVAEKKLEACIIPKDKLLALCKSQPELAMAFLKQVCRDSMRLEHRISALNQNSATERVAEALIYFNDHFQNESWARKELAEWAGTTPETVMRILSSFEEKGLIAKEGRKIKILNKDRLLRFVKTAL